MPCTIVLDDEALANMRRVQLTIAPNLDFVAFSSYFVNSILKNYLSHITEAVEAKLYECKTCNIRLTMNRETDFKYCPNCSAHLDVIYETEEVKRNDRIDHG